MDFIPLEHILKSKAAQLICYPNFEGKEAEERLRELQRLGVEGIKLGGGHVLNGLSILGKGKTSVVTVAHFNGGLVALKARRTDSSRSSMYHEAENLKAVNLVGVGPKLLNASHNFLIMELIEGEYFGDWLSKLEPPQKNTLIRVLMKLMQQARRLDEISLDHGELSRASRHIIINGERPVIIDFESASSRRRPANVQSLINYFYFNRVNRENMVKLLEPPERQPLIRILKRYKESQNEENFDSLIRFLF
ncbi:MAG: RIO1 family regulatory kinase/ATPase domain-containing protein [Candidatus Bathyarchaeia archaeon]